MSVNLQLRFYLYLIIYSFIIFIYKCFLLSFYWWVLCVCFCWMKSNESYLNFYSSHFFFRFLSFFLDFFCVFYFHHHRKKKAETHLRQKYAVARENITNIINVIFYFLLIKETTRNNNRQTCLLNWTHTKNNKTKII